MADNLRKLSLYGGCFRCRLLLIYMLVGEVNSILYRCRLFIMAPPTPTKPLMDNGPGHAFYLVPSLPQKRSIDWD